MEIKRNKAWRRFQENRVFKARMLKFAGWQIVVWDENGNCIEHPHWFEIAKEKWAKKYKDCSTPCSCAICRAEKYSRLHFKRQCPKYCVNEKTGFRYNLLYLDSVFKYKNKLVHNQAPIMNRLCPFLLNFHQR